MRLDLYLVALGLFASRAQAQAAIAAGRVRVNGAVVAKPSLKVSSGDAVEADGAAHPYVSRGGVKLAAALEAFGIDPAGKRCLDLGASTGGFTDVLLQAGAARVYAVDVGHGQLHPTIAADPRVINLEKTHAKDLSPALMPEPVELIVCDVSFISVRKALPFAFVLAAPGAQLVALIKPQFEVGRENIGKGGLVNDDVGAEAARGVKAWIEAQGWGPLGLMESPIRGGDGNREHLLGATKTT